MTVRVLQRDRANRIDVDTERDLLRDLAHAIMEAEKSHDVPSATCRPMKVGGVVPGQPQRPENQGRKGGKNPNPGYIQFSPAPCQCAPGCAWLKKDSPHGVVSCSVRDSEHQVALPAAQGSHLSRVPSLSHSPRPCLHSFPLFPTLQNASSASSELLS